jgi:two-component system OmpR family sensor kinase
VKITNVFTRFFVPRSLRSQLLSRSLFILAVLLLLIGIFQYLFMQQFLYRNKAESIHSQMLSIPYDIPRREGPGRPGFFIPDAVLAFVDTEGNYSIVSESPHSEEAPKLSRQEYQQLLQQKPKPGDYRIIRNESGSDQLVVFQPVGPRGHSIGMIQVSMSTKPLNDILLRQLLIFLVLSTGALIFGLLTFLPVLRRTLVPLSNMVDTVERIDAGNLNERLPTRQGQLEIDRLSVSFNGMLERLEASFEAEKEAKEQMRRFIADASHELRTPLTSIHGFLEVLLRGAASNPEQLHKALKSMHGESGRIIKLVQDLLLLAKLDRTPTFQLTEGRLDAVVREMEPQLRLLAGERNVSFAVAPDMKCLFDPDKMKQVILNLFHNAVQHTDPVNGRIRVSLSREAGEIVLAVQDNGPGIPEEHLAHVFDRFYRIDTSRARKHGGAGLGLSITKSIVDLHGGTIHVESKTGEGCSFRIRLPAYH